jgi:putative ABC transport system permease protein
MAEQIQLTQMAIAYVLLLAVLLLVLTNRLGVGRQLLIASFRMTVQLLLAGIALRYIFGFNFWYTTLLVLLVMLASAVHIVLGRVELKVRGLSLILLASIGVGSGLVTAVFIFLIVGRSPWYDAVYMLPIGGMIIGNAMTACALVVERFTSEVRQGRAVIETSLSLGATCKEASTVAFRSAYKAALLPTIVSMSGIGLVHLPGMMTGQILAGVEPMLAVRYQIAIIIAILAAAAISSLIALCLVRGRLFNSYHQIVMPDRPGI